MSNIPQISDRKLSKLRKQIRPVARFAKGKNGLFHNENGELYFIKVTAHPRTQTFFWEISAGEKCKRLKPFKEVRTHHGTGGFFFKPSEAEVLAQLPVDCLGTVVAYEIVKYWIADERDDSIAVLQLYTN